ncbi:hypothetical protein I8J29_19905 [Paenibacillus sp. MWE-103]|uniref:Uncharacterized protein n=1 Tax=Paenibacillus artemisiicola TaxID=1172618 RepID=A0ABS3WDU5_9BACL|nr:MULTISPECIES: hypothetical protein [Paenibacillus]MBO7746482.1 hypothetical protein [Paenibacillus artemisiicola]SFI61965.1 hypothetical protein SAMN02799624_01670 [Paenibacillus sp. UNC496MF]
MTTIRATFDDGGRAREAQHKLQFLRVDGIDESSDGTSWTATLDDELVERAIHLVRQTGGTVEL